MNVDLNGLVRAARDEIDRTAARFGIQGDVLGRIAAAQIDRADHDVSEYLGRTPSPAAVTGKVKADQAVKTLKSAAPNAPSDKCVASLATAHLVLQVLGDDRAHDDPSPQEAAELIQLVMMLVGSAIAHADPDGDPVEAFKRSWVEHGKKGGELRHASTNELKLLALERAKSMKGSHTQIARQLVNELPEALLKKSRDPERLIVDALRAASKRN